MQCKKLKQTQDYNFNLMRYPIPFFPPSIRTLWEEHKLEKRKNDVTGLKIGVNIFFKMHFSICVCVCMYVYIYIYIYIYSIYIFKWKWKWRDIRPSMVTHTRNSCSAFNPSKVHTHTAVNTHSSEHTHTHTHTRSSGQPFMLRCPGSSWGFGALLKGTSVVVLRVERALYIHSPHLQFLPARDSNSQPLDYESNSLTIRLTILTIKLLFLKGTIYIYI